jgi:hypothetical protein
MKHFSLGSIDHSPRLKPDETTTGEVEHTLTESLRILDAEPAVVVDLRDVAFVDHALLREILESSANRGDGKILVVAKRAGFLAARLHTPDANGIEVTDSMAAAAARSTMIHRRLQGIVTTRSRRKLRLVGATC